jgi:hypothetical protein
VTTNAIYSSKTVPTVLVYAMLLIGFLISLSWNLKTERKMEESSPLLPATAFCRAVLQLLNRDGVAVAVFMH